MRSFIKIPIACLAIITASGTVGPAKAEIIEAQWEVHQIRFRYSGFSTHYTCAGIESTLKRLLKLLGARDDARVETNCRGSSEIQRFHRIRLAFAMPVPADKTDISREIIPAEWQEVRVVGHMSRHLDQGDCELLEQFKREVMPHLQVRDLRQKIRCIPYRRDFSRVRLNMTALKALEKTELEQGRNEMTNDPPQPGK